MRVRVESDLYTEPVLESILQEILPEGNAVYPARSGRRTADSAAPEQNRAMPPDPLPKKSTRHCDFIHSQMSIKKKL